jgi:hypothetical protein
MGRQHSFAGDLFIATLFHAPQQARPRFALHRATHLRCDASKWRAPVRVWTIVERSSGLPNTRFLVALQGAKASETHPST